MKLDPEFRSWLLGDDGHAACPDHDGTKRKIREDLVARLERSTEDELRERLDPSKHVVGWIELDADVTAPDKPN